MNESRNDMRVAVVHCGELSPGAILLYLYIDDQEYGDGNFKGQIAQIGKDLGCPNRIIEAFARELRQHGFLVTERGQHCVEYIRDRKEKCLNMLKTFNFNPFLRRDDDLRLPRILGDAQGLTSEDILGYMLCLNYFPVAPPVSAIEDFLGVNEEAWNARVMRSLIDHGLLPIREDTALTIEDWDDDPDEVLEFGLTPENVEPYVPPTANEIKELSARAGFRDNNGE